MFGQNVLEIKCVHFRAKSFIYSDLIWKLWLSLMNAQNFHYVICKISLLIPERWFGAFGWTLAWISSHMCLLPSIYFWQPWLNKVVEMAVFSYLFLPRCQVAHLSATKALVVGEWTMPIKPTKSILPLVLLAQSVHST